MTTDLLVTGGSGMLGSALKALRPDAGFLSRGDGDLTDISQVRAIFRKHRPERVLHLAAKVGGVKQNALKNADFFTENVQINTNVLSVARETGVSRLISVLSTCAFPVFSDRASRESDLHSGMPFEGNLGYGCSKRMLDVHTCLLEKQYGCCFSTIAPVTMYGPRDNFDLEEGHVIGALIHKCCLRGRDGRELEVWGSGSAVRQFVYCGDVARILLESLERHDGPETTIVAADGGVTIRRLVESIVEVMGFDGKVVFNHGQPEGQLVKVVESESFSRRFPGFQFTPLKEGLSRTAEWFLSTDACPLLAVAGGTASSFGVKTRSSE